MQFTVDYINENIDIWESSKKKKIQQLKSEASHSPIEKNMVTNIILPQPSPEGKSSTSKRTRSGI